MASDKRKRDKGPALSDEEAARRERKKQRKEAKKEAKRKAKEQPSSSTPGGKKGKYEKSAKERKEKRERKKAEKEKVAATPSTSHNPFASSSAQRTSDNPFAAAAASQPANDASTFPPGFDFEATQRHLVRKRDSGTLSADDKKLLDSIQKHISSPGYVAPVQRTPKPRAAQEASSSFASSSGGGNRLSSSRSSAGKVSESKDLTIIDATGLSNEECLVEKQYRPNQLVWLQEDRPDFKIRWGRLGKDEIDAVDKRLVEWEQENDMDRDSTISLIFDREKRDAATYVNLIKTLTRSVPYRCFDTIRRYVRIHYNPLGHQGPWKSDEIDKLRDAVAKYANDWAKVSSIVGRSRTDCRLFVRDQKDKIEAASSGGGVTKRSPSTAGSKGADDEVDQLDSDAEMNEAPGASQRSRRAWTSEEETQLKQAVDALAGTDEAGGRGPTDARFPWKLVTDRMSTTRPPNKVRDKWQKLHSRDVRKGVIPVAIATGGHGEDDKGDDDLSDALKGRYNAQRDDYLFIKSLGKQKAALEFDDVAAVDWNRVADDLKLPAVRLRTIYTTMVKQYLGEERIHSSLKGVLADLKGPTKAARDAYKLRPHRCDAESEREYQKLKKRRLRAIERQRRIEAGLPVGKTRVNDDFIDDIIESDEEW